MFERSVIRTTDGKYYVRYVMITKRFTVTLAFWIGNRWLKRIFKVW